jgi:hypothetical protein
VKSARDAIPSLPDAEGSTPTIDHRGLPIRAPPPSSTIHSKPCHIGAEKTCQCGIWTATLLCIPITCFPPSSINRRRRRNSATCSLTACEGSHAPLYSSQLPGVTGRVGPLLFHGVQYTPPQQLSRMPIDSPRVSNWMSPSCICLDRPLIVPNQTLR